MAIIMELKSITKPLAKTLNAALTTAAKVALTQIEERHYVTDLKQLGIRRICKIGIALHGKQVKVAFSCSSSNFI